MTSSKASMISNYSSRDFSNPRELARRKERAGLTISLVIPARNEASTIGAIVDSVFNSLCRGAGLVDEIVVIDGSSDDATRVEAQSAGATVYSLDEAGPPIDCCGKGAALWKSQFVTRGDIVVFVDADIRNFGPYFVTGLVGPLLARDDIYFVKGYYQRPLCIGSASYENYGGRITEILVRPMLCAFVPELAEVFQPLGGEYAVRRSVLESLPFSSGYGVEIGLLFDFYRAYGLSHLAQTDLVRRVHRNRPMGELSTVVSGVLEAMVRKLEQHDILSIHGAPAASILFPPRDAQGEMAASQIELPPRRDVSVPVEA